MEPVRPACWVGGLAEAVRLICNARQSKVQRHTKHGQLPERSTEPVQIYQIGQRHVTIAGRGGGWYQTFIICLLVERLKQEGNIRKRSDI